MSDIISVQVNWDYIYQHLGEWVRNPNIVCPALFALHYFIAWIVIVFILQVKGAPMGESDVLFRVFIWVVSPIIVIAFTALGLAHVLFGYKAGTGKPKEINNGSK